MPLDMIAEPEIRKNLIAFLVDRMSLQDFEDWLVSNSWNMHLDSSPNDQDLVSAIELALSEYSSGDRSYSDLRHELAAISENVVASYKIVFQNVAPSRPLVFGANSYLSPVAARV